MFMHFGTILERDGRTSASCHSIVRAVIKLP